MIPCAVRQHAVEPVSVNESPQMSPTFGLGAGMSMWIVSLFCVSHSWLPGAMLPWIRLGWQPPPHSIVRHGFAAWAAWVRVLVSVTSLPAPGGPVTGFVVPGAVYCRSSGTRCRRSASRMVTSIVPCEAVTPSGWPGRRMGVLFVYELYWNWPDIRKGLLPALGGVAGLRSMRPMRLVSTLVYQML